MLAVNPQIYAIKEDNLFYIDRCEEHQNLQRLRLPGGFNT